MADTLAGRPEEIIAGKNYAHVAIPRRDGTVQVVYGLSEVALA